VVAGGEKVNRRRARPGEGANFAKKVGSKVQAMSPEDAVKKGNVLIRNLVRNNKGVRAAYRAPLAGKIIVYPSNPIALVTSKEAETLI
jgi:predicted dinucleotide-binding enzyme